LLIKGLVYENDPHETLISASLIWGIGDFGTKAVGGYGPNTLQPSLTFGKGFGDLPDSLKWQRPFAIAGAIAPELPLNGRTKTLLFDPSQASRTPRDTPSARTADRPKPGQQIIRHRRDRVVSTKPFVQRLLIVAHRNFP
jgi:hypothetical protein